MVRLGSGVQFCQVSHKGPFLNDISTDIDSEKKTYLFAVAKSETQMTH